MISVMSITLELAAAADDPVGLGIGSTAPMHCRCVQSHATLMHTGTDTRAAIRVVRIKPRCSGSRHVVGSYSAAGESMVEAACPSG